ncbi:hypothetical protein JXB02_05070 [Candidatus Woesearchaeota archaeon]|nr:hypothetical protein [Candidatus Woesearchaeota archaeon]
MQKQKLYLTAEALHTFLTDGSDSLDTLIMCRSAEVELTTSDQSLYEAVGSIEDKGAINLSKLAKLLEVTKTRSYEEMFKRQRMVLTPERAEAIRAKVREGLATNARGDNPRGDNPTTDDQNNNQAGDTR